MNTPGVWELNGRVCDVQGTPLYCADISTKPFRGDVARIQSADHTGGITREEARANAILITAAPDMLAALKGIARNAALDDAWLDPVRAAIAKAEGRPQP